MSLSNTLMKYGSSFRHALSDICATMTVTFQIGANANVWHSQHHLPPTKMIAIIVIKYLIELCAVRIQFARRFIWCSPSRSGLCRIPDECRHKYQMVTYISVERMRYARSRFQFYAIFKTVAAALWWVVVSTTWIQFRATTHGYSQIHLACRMRNWNIKLRSND